MRTRFAKSEMKIQMCTTNEELPELKEANETRKGRRVNSIGMVVESGSGYLAEDVQTSIYPS